MADSPSASLHSTCSAVELRLAGRAKVGDGVPLSAGALAKADPAAMLLPQTTVRDNRCSAARLTWALDAAAAQRRPVFGPTSRADTPPEEPTP